MLPRSIQLPAVLQDALALGASTLSGSSSATAVQTCGTPLTPQQQNAGMELMLRNSDRIDDLWYRTELNINKIKGCDLHIAELYANLEIKLALVMKLNMTLTAIADIKTQAAKSKELLAKVEQQLGDCAAAMLIMDDTREMVEIKRREAAEREARNKQLQEERRRTFEEEFKKDLLRFKETGEVEAPLCQIASPCDLSEINLEQDEDDQQALSRFLESSGEHDPEDKDSDFRRSKSLSKMSVLLEPSLNPSQDLSRVDNEDDL
ncbi:uncharacterized protein LOC111271893 isoform X2 [Varroa jacobsoni]|nr:uncharacterized protein LOC111253133 isoform X2 [Varroa destructor]XP_022708667.1 uncharacterized protein LOC111271893 isoform X2 [Varroa jacobsoni]